MNRLFYWAIIYVIFLNNLVAQFSLKENLTEGVVFHKLELKGPVAVQYLEIDLTNPNLNVESVLANNYLGNGGEGVSRMCERLADNGVKVIAGINGDFFGGEPHSILSSMISNGEFIKGSQRNKSSFGMLYNGFPFIEKLTFEGKLFCKGDTLSLKYLNGKTANTSAVYNRYYNKLFSKDSIRNYLLLERLSVFSVNDTGKFVVRKISNAIFEDTLKDKQYLIGRINEIMSFDVSLSDTVKLFLGTNPNIGSINELIGGLPRLVVNGKAIHNYLGFEGLTSKSFISKNPRTAIGFNADSTKLYMVTVDGRQNNYSIGMSLPELADFMVSIGCYQAVNLDGGGSTTMWVKGNIENSPSDKTGERPVHNAIVVYVK